MSEDKAFEPYELRVPDMPKRPSARETSTKQLLQAGMRRCIPGCRKYNASLQRAPAYSKPSPANASRRRQKTRQIKVFRRREFLDRFGLGRFN
jgi:hypothetical protein